MACELPPPGGGGKRGKTTKVSLPLLPSAVGTASPGRLRRPLCTYDNHASYHLHNWDPADDERMMMAIYYAEQVHPFPRYKNDLAKFKADWAAQAYDPGGASLTFAPADVEELEVLCEEAAEPEPEPPAPPAPKRKKHKRRRK